MTTTIVDLIGRAEATPWGAECGALLGEAIALADAAGEEQLAYAARLRLVANASMTHDNELAMATFAICEQTHSTDPLKYPGRTAELDLGLPPDYNDLYWMWKWVPGWLISTPMFSAADVEQSLTDLANAYQRAGVPGMAVAQRHLDWAVERADLPQIAHWLGVAASLPSDSYSDCNACWLCNQMVALLLLGEVETALRRLDEIITGGFNCAEEPARAYSFVLAELVAAGRLDDARRGLKLIMHSQRGLPDNHAIMGRAMIFLTRCGHSQRALTIGRRCLARVAAAPLRTDAHELLFTALAVAGAAETAAGRGDRLVPEADEPALTKYLGKTKGTTVAMLAQRAETAARNLAEKFDRRNGTNAHTDTLEKNLAAPTIDVVLPPPPDAAATLMETFELSADPETAIDSLLAAVDELIEAGQLADARKLAGQSCQQSLELEAGKLATGRCLEQLAKTEALLHYYQLAAKRYVLAAEAFNAAGNHEREVTCALHAVSNYLQHGNAIMAGQIAETALKSALTQTGSDRLVAWAQLLLAGAAVAAPGIDLADALTVLTEGIAAAQALSDQADRDFIRGILAGLADLSDYPVEARRPLLVGLADMLAADGQPGQAAAVRQLANELT